MIRKTMKHIHILAHSCILYVLPMNQVKAISASRSKYRTCSRKAEFRRLHKWKVDYVCEIICFAVEKDIAHKMVVWINNYFCKMAHNAYGESVAIVFHNLGRAFNA